MREPPARGLEMIRMVVTQGRTNVKIHGAVHSRFHWLASCKLTLSETETETVSALRGLW